MIVKPRKKEKVEKCFTCPLCTNLYNSPTTISECLHTFCKNCIEEKFITENLKACPICNVNLGVAPRSKLRPDYAWVTLLQKLFPSKPDIVKEGTETVKQKEKTISSLLASSSKVTLEPKRLMTFSKRRRKTSKPKQNVAIMEPTQPHREARPRLDIDLNKLPEDDLDEEENNLEKDTEVAPLNINETPLGNIDEPEITPNGREDQDNVPTSGGDTEERVEDIHSFCVFNRQVEEIPLQVYPNTILISSDGETKEVSGDERMKSNRKGKQESAATSSSRKKTGRKQKNNGGGNDQECVTPRSGIISGDKKPHYSPPVLRPRKGRRTINSADRTSEVKKMNSAAAALYVMKTMTPTAGKSEVKTIDSGAGTSEVKPMSSVAGTSEVKPMSSGAGTSGVKPVMSSGAGTSEVRSMNSGAGTSGVKPVMSSGAGTSGVKPVMSSGAGTSEVRSMNSGAGTSGVGIFGVAENRLEGRIRNVPVWFQLLASGNQNTDRPVLPELSSSYLRVTNRNMTVLYVKKYLVQKLSLQSEDQVEIWIRDEPVSSTLTLHDLVDWWVQTTPVEERKSAMVGSSAADFVMVLFYSFKESS